MTLRSRTVGIGQTRAAFRRLPPALRDETIEALRESAKEGASLGKDYMDRMGIGNRTGRLRKWYKASTRPAALQSSFGYNTKKARREAGFYAFFLNHGTVKMAARPFHDRASEEMEGAHDARIGEAVDRALRVFGK